MNVSLDQAIEIHAKVLKYRSGTGAPRVARKIARECAASGDHEGHGVWQRVAEVAETLLVVATAGGDPAKVH